ncbi:MAG: DUF4129 domain-containing protein [Thermoplasmata archaeon]|nr:DUF4129 domain-containing protein [Thermoplasmata archaeon]
MTEASPEPLPVGSPKELLAALLRRFLHPRPRILETRRPVEVPVITETKRLWSIGERPSAIRFAYAGALTDVQRAFGIEFPPDWTHEDILERGVSREMGSVPDFLVQLLRLYEPVRYGPGTAPPGQSPEPILLSIYAHPKMWGLYIAAVPAPEGARLLIGAPSTDPPRTPPASAPAAAPAVPP